MEKWRAFKKGGLNALLSRIAQIKKTADSIQSAVSGLGEDLVQLSDLTSQELAEKQDTPATASCTIPTSGWSKDSTAGYPNYYDLAVSGITAKDHAAVMLAPASLATATSCGLCPTCETLAGKIRFRSVDVPGAALTGEYWIEQGKE